MIRSYDLLISHKNIDLYSEPLSTHSLAWSRLGFPTGRDSATFLDKGTEVPQLSREKGTMGQAQNLAKGRDGTACQNPGLSRPVARF